MKHAFLVFTVLLFFDSVKGQEVYHLDVVNSPVIEVLQQLENNYGFRFSYDPNKLKKYTVSCNIRTNDTTRLVEEVFRYLPYTISSTQGVFLIIPDKTKKIKIPVVTGKVFNQLTGEPLAYAHIQTLSSGTVTDLDGKFKLKIRDVTDTITVSYLGYGDKKVGVYNINAELLIGLETDTSELPEIVINANTELSKTAEVSAFHINTSQLSSLPSLGQIDVLKSLQLLPGISATDETYSGLIVRGSGSEQNLVQMDGFTIYHLDHLFGIFSTFNPYTINQVSLYKGGFNAKYGGRLSSVVDSRIKAPAKDKVHGGVNLNPTSFNLFIESSIGKKVGFIASYRQSTRNFLSKTVYDDFILQNRVRITQTLEPTFEEESLQFTPDINFFDLNTKIRITPSDRDVIDVNFFLSGDDYNGSFSEENLEELFRYELIDNANWGNLGSSISWDRFNNPSQSNHFTASFSSFSSTSEFLISESYSESVDQEADEFESDQFVPDTTLVYSDLDKTNLLNDATFKWTQKRQLKSFNSLEIGTELNLLKTDYNINYYEDWEERLEASASIFSGFLQYGLEEGKFELSGGFRGSFYSRTNQFFAEPRIIGNLLLTSNLKLKASYSIHHQFLNRISITPFGNSDQFYWVLTDDNLYPVMKSRHWIGGFNFNKDKWTIDVELYHKESSGILESEFIVNSDFSGTDDDFEDLISNGTNTATGMDVFWKYRSKIYTGWISYSLSRSENQFETINNGDPYPSVFDQRHEVNWVNQIHFGPWEFGGTIIYGSGKPYTPANPNAIENLILYDIDKINSERLPAYHRTDISVKYTAIFNQISLSAGCTLFNIFNTKNIKSRRYTLFATFDEEDNEIDRQVVPVDLTLLGFTPNFFLELKF